MGVVGWCGASQSVDAAAMDASDAYNTWRVAFGRSWCWRRPFWLQVVAL